MTGSSLWQKRLALFLWVVAVFFLLLIPVCLIHGFPLPFFNQLPFRFKSLRKPFEISFILLIVGLIIHPNRKSLMASLRDRANKIANSPGIIGILVGVYFLFFLWEQITRYLSLELNFIPFLFYDYMLWYFDQAKFCFTGLLHGYYHANLILLLLYPVWKLIQSPWVLHVAESLIAAIAVIPFYYWSRQQLKHPLSALLAAFLYLNFRYLQNVLSVNFAVEIFYPLFIFSAVYFAEKGKNMLYFLSIILGLLVKEDSTIYFGALGFFFLFSPSQRLRGLLTILLAGLYPIFLLKIFFPWSKSTILRGDLNNYARFGTSLGEISGTLWRQPFLWVRELFFPFEKVETLVKLNAKLLFIPLFSPWMLLVLASIYPVFFQGGEYFIKLDFYYGAAVIPFLFLAFVDGWRRVRSLPFFQPRPYLLGVLMVALVFLNGFNLKPLHFTRDDIKTILLTKSLPKESIVVTQGHLLPYLGYRKWNFYIARPYGAKLDTKEGYSNPDYYLFDFEANSYPQSPEEIRQMADSLKINPKFKISYQDHRRLLLEKRRD